MTWDAFFSTYERRLVETEAALDEGHPLPEEVTQPFVAPSGLGPMPSSYEGRALDVLKRSAQLEQRLRNNLEAIGRDLGNATRMGSGARRFSGQGENFTPTYVDRSV